MKAGAISFAVWILAVLCAVAVFLILAFLACSTCGVALFLAPSLRAEGTVPAIGYLPLLGLQRHSNQAIFRRRLMQFASIRSWALRSTFLSAVGVSLCFCSFAKPDPTGRIVKYSQQDIIQVRVKLRFSTLIILPQDEEILDFATGDREFWIINGVHNLCYVHPAQTAIRSDLHLITSSGRVYSFLLTEISNEPNAEPDLKLFVEPKEQSTIAGADSPQGFVRVSEVEAYRKELEATREQAAEQIRTAGIKAAEDISKFRADYAGKLQFDYELDKKASAEPFLVSAIYHDDTFTYIRCAAREKPSLYEIKDGKPNLINFQLEDGVYIIPKILDNAYLTIGKKKLAFTRKS